MMKISEASFADVTDICILVNRAYRGESSRKGWTTEADFLDGIRIDEDTLLRYFYENNSTILKCTDDDQQITGCVYLKMENEFLYLGMLTVSPSLQGNGIGKMLLQASEEKAKQLSCKSIMMTVITYRHELIGWYKRHGYYETGQKQPFPRGEKFGMPKVPLEFLVMEKKVGK